MTRTMSMYDWAIGLPRSAYEVNLVNPFLIGGRIRCEPAAMTPAPKASTVAR